MDEKPSTIPVPAITSAAVYVVNGGSPSISVLSADDGSVLRTIQISNASYPHHISLSPDRSRLALAIPGMDLSAGHDIDTSSGGHHGGMGSVLLLDATTGKTIAARTLDNMNHNAAFTPDGAEIWTSQMMGHTPGTVLILDATTLATKQTITVGSMPAEVTFAQDGKLAFVANGMSNSVSVIDVASKAVIKSLAVCEGPVGAWSGGDNMMYTDCETAGALAVIDASSLADPKPISLGFMPGMAATRPGTSGELWVTNSDDGTAGVYELATGEKAIEIATGAGAHGITFSPDGSKVFISNQAAGTVSVVDCAAKTVTKQVTVGSKPNGIAYRPL